MSTTEPTTDDPDEEEISYRQQLEMYPEFERYQYGFYKDFAEADGVKWAGSGWAYEAVPEGLDDDVHFLAGEPYGAIVAYNQDISRRHLNAADANGFHSELCGYMVNYWGGLTQDEYVLPDGTIYDFPEIDFNFTSHICCTHSKWYQMASELEDDYTEANDEVTPFDAIDIIGGKDAHLDEDIVDYKVDQLQDAIEWMQDVTGRDFDDEKFINAAKNEMTSMSYWARVTNLQKNDPAPLEERRMFTLYAPTIARRATDRAAELYQELYDEVSEMVENNETVTGEQNFRFISDSPPPWAHLDIYRYMRENYGAISLGSLYSLGLTGIWEGYDGEDEWSWEPLETPMEQGVELEDREETLRELVKWNLRRPSWNVFGSDLQVRKDITLELVEEFDVDFVLVHLNRGCEGWAQNQTEVSNYLKEHGVPVLEYEGNQADTRDFDPSELKAKVDSFLEGRFGVEASGST